MRNLIIKVILYLYIAYFLFDEFLIIDPECLDLESNNKAYCKLLLRLKALKADVGTREHDIKELIERRDGFEQDLDEQIRIRFVVK